MRHSTPARSSSTTVDPILRVPTVVVVDPQNDDYLDLHVSAANRAVNFKIVASAEEALRLSGASTIDLWMINTTLPGLSGLELCSMLKTRSARTTLFLVSNEYSEDVERRAWAARPTLFGCKAACAEMLDQWLRSHGTQCRDAQQEVARCLPIASE